MKQKHQQREEPSAPSVVLSALIPEPLPRRSAVTFKLTDECSAAINEAAAARRKIRLHHQKDSCVLEVIMADGSTKRFECTVQPMGYPIDAIQYDESTSQYQTLSAINNKIQVKATDRTFAETREKAQKLVEEQQKHKAKDLNSKVQRPVTALSQRRILSGTGASTSAIGASKPKVAAVSIRPSNALAPNIGGAVARNAPEATMTSKPPTAISAAKFGLGVGRPPMMGNAGMKPINHRSPASSQDGSIKTTSTMAALNSVSPSNSQISGGLSSRIGYAPKTQPPTFRKRPAPSKPATVLDTPPKPPALMEVDTSTHNKFMPSPSNSVASKPAVKLQPQQQQSLQPSPLSSQQAGSTSGGPPPEKRRAFVGGYGIMSTGTTNFVPAGGGSGAETMPAIQPTDTTPSPSPSSAASSTMDSPNSNYGGGSRSHNQPHHQHHSKPSSHHQPRHEYGARHAADQPPSAKIPANDIRASSTAATRKERYPNGSLPSGGGPSKDENWRSLSTSTADKSRNYHHSESQRRPTVKDGSLTKDTRPSCDYHKMFREIKNINEAKRYHDIFTSEYPEYRDCFEVLSRVAEEFHELERALKLTAVNTPDRDKMEDAIQDKFATYQNDENFLQKRQKHTDLRAKLDVLKKRIIQWEEMQKKANAGSSRGGGGAAAAPGPLSDMMVM